MKCVQKIEIKVKLNKRLHAVFELFNELREQRHFLGHDMLPKEGFLAAIFCHGGQRRSDWFCDECDKFICIKSWFEWHRSQEFFDYMDSWT